MPDNSDYLCGPFVWGRGASKGWIYASSEHPDKDNFDCEHAEFDVEKCSGRQGSDLGVVGEQHEGDAIAITSDGKEFLRLVFLAAEIVLGCRLALITRSSEGHWLRICYPRQQWKDILDRHKLLDFSTGPNTSEGEVNCATFSDDGLYLALARTDNRTHVYDTRMLGAGPLHQYSHGTSTIPRSHYGVVHAQWVTRGRGGLGLVTGGNDGILVC